MRHVFLRTAALAIAAILLAPVYALGTDNATVTLDGVFLMKGPSFIGEEVADVDAVRGGRVTVVSRTSFTDHLAAVPDDYWYLIQTYHCGALIAGYIHGSALIIDDGARIPIYDPPGFSSNKPPVISGRYTVVSSIGGKQCVRDEGVIMVPAGTVGTHFTIVRFDSSFTPCPGTEYGSIIGFSIVSATEPGEKLFSYEEHIADDPADLQQVKDGFYYFDLESGNYTVTVRGGAGTVLELTYELVGVE